MSKYLDGAAHIEQAGRTIWTTEEGILADAVQAGIEAARKSGHLEAEPASWHTRFIAEQRERGQVQRWRLVGLEALLEDTEAELKMPLPEPGAIDVWETGAILFEWHRNGRYIGFTATADGEVTFNKSDSPYKYSASDPARLATALRELFAETEGEAL